MTDGYPKLYMPDGENAEANPHVCILEELPCLACALVEVLDDRDEALDLAAKVVASTEARSEVLADVVARKIHGVDCTEDESALIKAYLSFTDLGRDLGHFGASLVTLFPLEWAEVDTARAEVDARILGLVGAALEIEHAAVFAPGHHPPLAADRWMYQVGDTWMAVTPGEDEAEWFADCEADRSWTPRPRVYPIDQIPPFGTLIYGLADGDERTHDVSVPVGPQQPHPLACPFCGSEDVSASQPDYQIRPARLNPDGSYTIGDQTDAADWDGPNLFYCTACNSDYPVPVGAKEHFDPTLKVEYSPHDEQPDINAKVFWHTEIYIPEPTGMEEG